MESEANDSISTPPSDSLWPSPHRTHRQEMLRRPGNLPLLLRQPRPQWPRDDLELLSQERQRSKKVSATTSHRSAAAILGLKARLVEVSHVPEPEVVVAAVAQQGCRDRVRGLTFQGLTARGMKLLPRMLQPYLWGWRIYAMLMPQEHSTLRATPPSMIELERAAPVAVRRKDLFKVWAGVWWKRIGWAQVQCGGTIRATRRWAVLYLRRTRKRQNLSLPMPQLKPPGE